jgi:MFS family permease
MSINPTVPGGSLFAALRSSATLAPFRHRIFAAIWTANLVSSFGSLTQSVGASWLMTTIAPSPDMVALVQAAMTLPILLFSLATGAIADIWSRRKVMLAAQMLMFVVSATLAALAFTDAVTPWLLLGFTFALGTGAALHGPAWQAAVGEQVPRADIPAAVALNSLGFNIARALGPAVGGLIVAAAGSRTAFLFNAVSYLGLIVVLARWRSPAGERLLPPETMGTAIRAGLRYAGQSLLIRAVLVRALGFGLCGSAVWALLPLVARHLVGGGPLTYGLLLGALGAGAILGALTSTPLRRHWNSEIVVRLAVAVFGLALLGAAVIDAMPLLMLLLLLAGTAWVLALSSFNIAVQLSAPRWVLGRAMAVYQMAVFGGMAGGSWLWGMAAAQSSIALALAMAGAAMLATLLLAWRLPLPEHSALDLDPSGAWPEPEVALDFDPRSGPVVTTVEYRVAPEDAPTFIAAMRAVRRIRRRDGARNWTLLQDIAEPEIWVERFEATTWLDHLRQHHRVTMDDRAIEARMLALHKSPEPPRIRHLLERPLMAVAPATAGPATARREAAD